jgi:hypothetical protein
MAITTIVAIETIVAIATITAIAAIAVLEVVECEILLRGGIVSTIELSSRVRRVCLTRILSQRLREPVASLVCRYAIQLLSLDRG